MCEGTAAVLGLEGVDVERVESLAQGYVVKVRLRRPDGCPRCNGKIHRHGRQPGRETAHTWVGAHWVRLNFVPVRYRC